MEQREAKRKTVGRPAGTYFGEVDEVIGDVTEDCGEASDE
jgi:hypothetical protein